MYQIASLLVNGVYRNYIRVLCSLNKKGFEEGKWVYNNKFTPVQKEDFINSIYNLNEMYLICVEYIEKGWLCSLSKLKINRDDIRSDNNYALRRACYYGYLEVVKYLVETFDLNRDDIRSENNEALRWTCQNGYLEVVKYIVNRFQLNGYDIRSVDNYSLRWACENGHLEVVKYIVDIETDRFDLNGDDIRSDDNYALRWACYYGHLEVVKYLVKLETLHNSKGYLYKIG